MTELERALSCAGWFLVVVDGAGRVVEPMGSDGVVDGGGRHYPAHVDVRPVGPDRNDWGRRSRDQWAPRTHAGHSPVEALTARSGERRADHPTARDVMDHQEAMRLVRKWRQIAESEARRYLRMANGEWAADVMECLCPIACFDNVLCVEWCPCQCEPPGVAAGG